MLGALVPLCGYSCFLSLLICFELVFSLKFLSVLKRARSSSLHGSYAFFLRMFCFSTSHTRTLTNCGSFSEVQSLRLNSEQPHFISKASNFSAPCILFARELYLRLCSSIGPKGDDYDYDIRSLEERTASSEKKEGK